MSTDDNFNIIYEEKENLIINWDTNCIHITGDKYLTSSLSGAESNVGVLMQETNILPCIVVFVQLKHEDVLEAPFRKDLYEKIKRWLIKFKKEDPEIEIIIPDVTKIRGDIKPGMEEIVQSFEQKNAKIMAKYNSLCSELLKLCTDELYILPTPKLFNTDGYYDWIEANNNYGFEIRCHYATKFYQYLLENEFIGPHP